MSNSRIRQSGDNEFFSEDNHHEDALNEMLVSEDNNREEALKQPVLAAAINGDIQAIHEIFANNPDAILSKTGTNETTLFWATKYEQASVIEYLLNHDKFMHAFYELLEQSEYVDQDDLYRDLANAHRLVGDSYNTEDSPENIAWALCQYELSSDYYLKIADLDETDNNYAAAVRQCINELKYKLASEQDVTSERVDEETEDSTLTDDSVSFVSDDLVPTASFDDQQSVEGETESTVSYDGSVYSAEYRLGDSFEFDAAAVDAFVKSARQLNDSQELSGSETPELRRDNPFILPKEQVDEDSESTFIFNDNASDRTVLVSSGEFDQELLQQLVRLTEERAEEERQAVAQLPSVISQMQQILSGCKEMAIDMGNFIDTSLTNLVESNELAGAQRGLAEFAGEVKSFTGSSIKTIDACLTRIADGASLQTLTSLVEQAGATASEFLDSLTPLVNQANVLFCVPPIPSLVTDLSDPITPPRSPEPSLLDFPLPPARSSSSLPSVAFYSLFSPRSSTEWIAPPVEVQEHDCDHDNGYGMGFG